MSSSLEQFSKNIYYKGFVPAVRGNSVFMTKKSFMLVKEVKENEEGQEFTFLSCDKTGLGDYAEFIKSSGRISQYHLAPIFSPEEQVFAPYFGFLRLAAPFVNKDEHVKQLFEKAFGEYEGKNYSNCIGTIGLIAEDYLTQVLETFFREVTPKGLTLGQLYEHIHSRIQEKYSKPEQHPKDLSSLYKEITVAVEDVKSNPGNRKDKDCLELLRKVLGIIKEDREIFEKKVERVKNAPKRTSVFTSELRDNLTDLIRFRNAVSHRTMIPIGSYEALRSVYCLMSLVMWWGKEKTDTQWELSPDAIIRASILRNTGIAV